MDKKGRTSGIVWFLAIALVGVALMFAFGVPQNIQGGNDGDVTNPTACGDSTGVLTVSARSTLEGGTDPSSPTITAGINGGPVTTTVTSGTTAFAVGSDIEVLVSKADYIDKSFTFEMPCGGITLDAPLFYATSDNPSISLKDPNNADATLTDAIGGGATNLTNVDVGATVDFDAEFKGTSGEGTGNMIYVIEFPAGSGANITDVTMGGLNEVAVPTVYTSQNAGSEVVAFEVPSIEGAIKQKYSVIATLGTGKDLSGGVYTDLFAAQEFVDDDKTISSGVEDSDGTAKYENSLDSDFFIAAS